MQTTSNYGYNMVESIDTANIPVQISPNFSKIDTDLKAVSDAAITSAVDTFASNTHALVRDDADRNALFFVAPTDYVAGDVFTLDGVNMNVTDVAGNALESNAFRINSVVCGVVYGTRLTLMVVNPVNIPTLDADNVTYDNAISGLTASDVQAAIDEIEAQINNLPTPSAGNISYNNTISELIATNVQQAIDELANLIKTPTYITTGLTVVGGRCIINAGGYYLKNGICYVDITITTIGSAPANATIIRGLPEANITGDITAPFNNLVIFKDNQTPNTGIRLDGTVAGGVTLHLIGSYTIL